MDASSSPIHPQPGEAVLLIIIRALGDALLTLPLINNLKRNHPEIHLTLLLESLAAQALRYQSPVDEVLIAPPRGSSLQSYIPIIKGMRSHRFALAIDCISTPGSALLSYLCGAPNRVGFAGRFRTAFYTRPILRPRDHQYSAYAKLALLKPLGMDIDRSLPKLEIPSNAIESAITWFRDIELDGKPVIAFAPWSKRPYRRWNIGVWREFLERSGGEFTWLMFAAENERDELKSLERLTSCRIIWAGAADVMQAAALMSRCRLYTGMDSGLKHLAVAVGLRTLTVFSGSNPDVWNPPDTERYPYIVSQPEPRAPQADLEQLGRHFAKLCEQTDTTRSGMSEALQ